MKTWAKTNKAGNIEPFSGRRVFGYYARRRKDWVSSHRTSSLVLLLSLFRHCAENLNTQEERLATSPQLVTRLDLPNAIVVRSHVHKNNVVSLTPETAGTVGV